MAGFYSSLPSPRPISLDSISIYGLGAPEGAMLADTASGLSQIILPFDIQTDQSSFAISYDALHIADTITFSYTRQPYFVSSECGVIYKYIMRDILHTNNLIDSVKCPDGVITNATGENIKIYFKTREDLL